MPMAVRDRYREDPYGNSFRTTRPRPACPRKRHRSSIMLHYALIFFVVAIIAAIFGFSGIAAGAAGIAKILFVLFLAGAAIAVVLGLVNRSGGA
jgi:uncharacterized membrane protein YtjA (UPF0391 family)